MDQAGTDIESVVSWALRDELPKQALQALKDMGMMSEGPGRATGVSPMFRLAQLGTNIDFSREPGFPDAAGPPHPDALVIGEAIRRLPAAVENFPWWTLRLDAGLGAFSIDVRAIWKQAAQAVASLVMVKGKLKARPIVGDELPTPRPKRYEANGKVIHLRDVTRKTYKWNEEPGVDKPTVETLFSEAAHPYKGRGGKAWPAGAYVPVVYEPTPHAVVLDRAEYAVWRIAMDLLVKDLEGKLTSVSVEPCTAAYAPWLGDQDRPTAPELRVVVDQATDARHRDEHEWALAHRLYEDELERQQHRDRARVQRTTKRATARRQVNEALDKIAA
jgi:hypothetical protein